MELTPKRRDQQQRPINNETIQREGNVHSCEGLGWGRRLEGVLSGTLGETSLRKGHLSRELGWGRKAKQGHGAVQRHRGGESSEPEQQLREGREGRRGNKGQAGQEEAGEEAGSGLCSPQRHVRGESLHRHLRDRAWTSVKPGHFS